MGQWILRKKESGYTQGICVACGIKPQKPKYNKGRMKYNAICTGCSKRLYKPKIYVDVYYS